jgi:hypothetical protein
VINQAWLFQTLGNYYPLPLLRQCKKKKECDCINMPGSTKRRQSTGSVREDRL